MPNPRSSLSRLAIAVLSLLAAATTFGCKETLETGYEPRPLNASDDSRRAFYAPAFSPEAQGRNTDNQQSTIRPGGMGSRY